MNISYFKVIGMVGMLAEELSKIAEDGKVTVTEAFDLMKMVCERLGLDFDTEGFELAAGEEGKEEGK
jgi:hypothetical protein